MDTFADDTAYLASPKIPTHVSNIIKSCVNTLQIWLAKWKIKSAHITFTLRKNTCPAVSLNNVNIPLVNDVKYLGMHLDRRVTWPKHIFTKRK